MRRRTAKHVISCSTPGESMLARCVGGLVGYTIHVLDGSGVIFDRIANQLV